MKLLRRVLGTWPGRPAAAEPRRLTPACACAAEQDSPEAPAGPRGWPVDPWRCPAAGAHAAAGGRDRPAARHPERAGHRQPAGAPGLTPVGSTCLGPVAGGASCHSFQVSPARIAAPAFEEARSHVRRQGGASCGQLCTPAKRAPWPRGGDIARSTPGMSPKAWTLTLDPPASSALDHSPVSAGAQGRAGQPAGGLRLRRVPAPHAGRPAGDPALPGDLPAERLRGRRVAPAAPAGRRRGPMRRPSWARRTSALAWHAQLVRQALGVRLRACRAAGS